MQNNNVYTCYYNSNIEKKFSKHLKYKIVIDIDINAADTIVNIFLNLNLI